MNQIMTGAEFLARIKREAKIVDTSEDTLILELLNELLTLACTADRNLREFQIDQTWAIAGTSSITIDTVYLGRLEYVFYQQMSGGSVTKEWVIKEISEVIPLAVVANRPTAFTFKQAPPSASSIVPTYTMTFHPSGQGVIGDRIRIIGVGFKSVANLNTDTLPWVSLYPYLITGIIERLMIKRQQNVTAEQFSKLSERSANIISNIADDDTSGNS